MLNSRLESWHAGRRQRRRPRQRHPHQPLHRPWHQPWGDALPGGPLQHPPRHLHCRSPQRQPRQSLTMKSHRENEVPMIYIPAWVRKTPKERLVTLRLVEKGKGAAEGKGLGDQIWDLCNRNLRSGMFFFLTKTNRKNLFHLYLKHDIISCWPLINLLW